MKSSQMATKESNASQQPWWTRLTALDCLAFLCYVSFYSSFCRSTEAKKNISLKYAMVAPQVSK
jgi:hypothetical protein